MGQETGRLPRLVFIVTLACGQLLAAGCAPLMTAAAAHATAIAAAVDVAPLVLFAGAVGTLGVVGGAGNESEIHEPGTFGAFLQNARTEIDLLVQKAIKDQEETVVIAGLQVLRAVSRARVAYIGSLGQKDSSLGAPERAFEADIAAMIATLVSGDNRAIKETGARAQIVAGRLRLPDGAPQLASFGPVYLFSFLPFQSISLRGTFPTDYKNGQLPQLTVKGKTYTAYSYSTESIEFSLPTRLLISDDQPLAISWHKAELAIPWDKPLFDPVARGGYSNFVVIGVLPDSLGRATVDHSIDSLRTEEKTRASDDFALKTMLDPGQTRCLELSPQERTEGWKIVKGSGKALLTASAPGSRAQDHGLQSEDDRSVCWTVSAADDAAGEAISWKISARIRRHVAESRVDSETFDMRWGENRTFAYPPGTWRVRYSIFNRGVTEVTGTEQWNPFVRIDSDRRGVTIRTYPF